MEDRWCREHMPKSIKNARLLIFLWYKPCKNPIYRFCIIKDEKPIVSWYGLFMVCTPFRFQTSEHQYLAWLKMVSTVQQVLSASRQVKVSLVLSGHFWRLSSSSLEWGRIVTIFATWPRWGTSLFHLYIWPYQEYKDGIHIRLVDVR